MIEIVEVVGTIKIVEIVEVVMVNNGEIIKYSKNIKIYRKNVEKS